MCCDMLWCDIAQYDTIHDDTIWFDMMWFDLKTCESSDFLHWTLFTSQQFGLTVLDTVEWAHADKHMMLQVIFIHSLIVHIKLRHKAATV